MQALFCSLEPQFDKYLTFSRPLFNGPWLVTKKLVVPTFPIKLVYIQSWIDKYSSIHIKD